MPPRVRGKKREADQSEWGAWRFASGGKGLMGRHGNVRIVMAASDAAAGIASWQNPHAFGVLVKRTILNVTTPSSGACTTDIGTAATPISNDTIIDGLSLAAAGVFDSQLIATRGTNGVDSVLVPSGEYFTASKKTGAAAGLAGTLTFSWIEA